MKRVNVPLMLVTLIASAAHAVYPAARADRGIAGAAGRQRYSRHAAGLHL